jgi:hypothetical protein
MCRVEGQNRKILSLYPKKLREVEKNGFLNKLTVVTTRVCARGCVGAFAHACVCARAYARLVRGRACARSGPGRVPDPQVIHPFPLRSGFVSFSFLVVYLII